MTGQPPSARARVLVVDDLEANRIAMSALLETMPCDVILADSGNEALRQLLRPPFAVMLLDVQMPDMDGYEVARHARQNPATADVPIIFVTATHETEEARLRGYGSGAVDYLFKPVNATILRSKVRIFLELFERRREVSEGLVALRQAYDDLRRTQAQLIQAEKMASLGQLVAGIAHEINNPLGFCISHLGVARGDLEKIQAIVGDSLPAEAQHPWGRATKRLDEMNMGLDRIRDLVLKLRTFSRLDEDEHQTARVCEGIHAVTTILGHKLHQRISLDLKLCDDDEIECYPGLLNQALMNLIANAIDAIEDRGTIRIETQRQHDTLTITITDNGIGIPQGIRHRITDPFFTTKDVGVGTGLGLSITDSIVRRHRGTLTFDDADGGGTVVRLTLPTTP